jgi:phosphotransferase system enzyme I (PtsP)
MKKYYDPCHPAVLYSIKRVVDVAGEANKEISICGEMAADPLSAVLLMGIGITEFSVSSPAIPVIKQAIRKVTMATAREIAAKALSMDTGTEIRVYLEKMGKELGLEGRTGDQ